MRCEWRLGIGLTINYGYDRFNAVIVYWLLCKFPGSLEWLELDEVVENWLGITRWVSTNRSAGTK